MNVLALSIGVMLLGATAAMADATCTAVADDLTGSGPEGQHTMLQLRRQAEAGDCSAAADLSRRAKDAAGFLETHCPADAPLRDTAAEMLKLGQDTLQTSECQN